MDDRLGKICCKQEKDEVHRASNVCKKDNIKSLIDIICFIHTIYRCFFFSRKTKIFFAVSSQEHNQTFLTNHSAPRASDRKSIVDYNFLPHTGFRNCKSVMRSKGCGVARQKASY